MSGEVELDDPFIVRYADRVADDREVLWRADFARVLDYEGRGYEEDPALLLRAREIRDQWATDPQVAARWNELDEIHSAWIFAPEAMRRAHEVTMPGGLRPPGMDDTRWASHMQAREMAGHGAWPGFEPTFSTDVSERHEPMTEITDHDDLAEAEQWRPEGTQSSELTDWERDLLAQTTHVLDSETESEIERQMRTDYERAQRCHSKDPLEYDPADVYDAHEYSAPWMEHEDPRYLDEWINLGDAEELWRRDPDAAAAQLADQNTPALQRRHLEQGRDLARGIYARDVKEVDYVTATADSSDPTPAPAPVPDPWRLGQNQLPSWDAARNDPARPVPAFSGVADRTAAINAFSSSASVNAFAAVAMERDEMER